PVFMLAPLQRIPACLLRMAHPADNNCSSTSPRPPPRRACTGRLDARKHPWGRGAGDCLPPSICPAHTARDSRGDSPVTVTVALPPPRTVARLSPHRPQFAGKLLVIVAGDISADHSSGRLVNVTGAPLRSLSFNFRYAVLGEPVTESANRAGVGRAVAVRPH